MKKNSDMHPVLIVGAGPTGLMMAHELGRYGVPFVLIDKDNEKSPYSRAIGVQIRTLEIFHALGLYNALIQKSHSINGAAIYAEGNSDITIDFPINENIRFRPLIIDQPHTEQTLEEALANMGNAIQRGVSLVDFHDQNTHVQATLSDENGQTQTRDFSFIVGADGAHSLVRKSMNDQFFGSTYDDAFILADASCHHALGNDRFRIFFKNKLFLALIPMHGENHYRLISVRRGERQKKGPDPTIDEFRDIARSVVPFALTIDDPVWVSRFFVQCRSARFYQQGRVFLAGDAAHIHSPAGGQGMNTGLQDSFNLAFKLAMVVKGIAKPNLLATYQQERKPVGDFLIKRTDRWFKFMVKSSLWARLLRIIVLPLLAKKTEAIKNLFTILSQTAIRYEAGARCKHNNHIDIEGFKVGARVPNIQLMSSHLEKTNLHSHILGLKFSILFFMPKNVGKKIVKDCEQAIHKLVDKFGSVVCCYLIFHSDFDADKAVLEKDYWIASLQEVTNEKPIFLVIRPDHHIFCMGTLDQIGDIQVNLADFLYQH